MHSVESFQISLSLSSPPSSAKTGPDMASALCLLGQLLRWSGPSAGSMIHLDFRWSRTAAIRARETGVCLSFQSSFKSVKVLKSVTWITWWWGRRLLGVMLLLVLVTSSVCTQYEPTIMLPRGGATSCCEFEVAFVLLIKTLGAGITQHKTWYVLLTLNSIYEDYESSVPYTSHLVGTHPILPDV